MIEIPEQEMRLMIFQILGLERKNSRTNRLTDKSVAGEIEKIIRRYEQTM